MTKELYFPERTSSSGCFPSRYNGLPRPPQGGVLRRDSLGCPRPPRHPPGRFRGWVTGLSPGLPLGFGAGVSLGRGRPAAALRLRGQGLVLLRKSGRWPVWRVTGTLRRPATRLAVQSWDSHSPTLGALSSGSETAGALQVCPVHVREPRMSGKSPPEAPDPTCTLSQALPHPAPPHACGAVFWCHATQGVFLVPGDNVGCQPGRPGLLQLPRHGGCLSVTECLVAHSSPWACSFTERLGQAGQTLGPGEERDTVVGPETSLSEGRGRSDGEMAARVTVP